MKRTPLQDLMRTERSQGSRIYEPKPEAGPSPKRKPIPKRRSKPRRGVVKDPKYLDWIRTLPCVVCILPWKLEKSGVAYSNVQKTPTEAAHVGDRGLGQKCSDREAIPLCERHHRTGPLAHHVLGKKFWAYHSLERDAIIAQLNKEHDSL